ncbi:MAG: ATP-binding cassette domain-containing protein [Planctomycetes bacterium]|nr:ATP-binding cassette domain-containing protein [Planctomycetota bacterium]
MASRPVVVVEDLWKRYSKTLQRGTLYAVQDGTRAFLGMRKASPDTLRNEEFWSVRGVSFQLEPGESLALVGRNGAGKTTLLKVLSGVIAPDRGEVRVRGRVVALMMIGAGFHPMLTGRENVYVYGSILGLKRREIDERLARIVEFAELSEFLDTPVKYYSSGMYMRLAFSVAAHSDPQVFVVDEVLAVGDQAFREKCVEHLLEQKRRGCSLLIVSHAAGYLRRLADRGLWLDRGAPVLLGPIDDVLDRYHAALEMRPAPAPTPPAALPLSAPAPEPAAPAPAPRLVRHGADADAEIRLACGSASRLHFTLHHPGTLPEPHLRLWIEDEAGTVRAGATAWLSATTHPQAGPDDVWHFHVTVCPRLAAGRGWLALELRGAGRGVPVAGRWPCVVAEGQSPAPHEAGPADAVPVEGIGYAELRATASLRHDGAAGELCVQELRLEGHDPALVGVLGRDGTLRLLSDLQVRVPPASFRSGEACTATLRLRTPEELRDASVALSFRQPRGGRSAGMRVRRELLPAGTHELRVGFALVLSPGQYLAGLVVTGTRSGGETLEVHYGDFAILNVVGPRGSTGDVLLEPSAVEEADAPDVAAPAAGSGDAATFRILRFAVEGAEAPAAALLHPGAPAVLEVIAHATAPVPRPTFKFSFLGPQEHVVARMAEFQHSHPLQPLRAGEVRRYRVRCVSHLAGGRYHAQAALMAAEGAGARVTDRRPAAVVVHVPTMFQDQGPGRLGAWLTAEVERAPG